MIYNFEHDAPADVIFRYVWMDAKYIQVVNQTEVLTRGIEWITPRVNTLLNLDLIQAKTYKVNRADTTLVQKLESICEGLNMIAYMHDAPEIRTERVTRFAASMRHGNFGDFRVKLLEQAKPVLIEWMLAMAVFQDGRKEVKTQYKNQKANEKTVNSALARVTQAKQRLDKIQSEVNNLEAYIENQNQHLTRKKAMLESERVVYEEHRDSLAALRQNHPELFDEPF